MTTVPDYQPGFLMATTRATSIALGVSETQVNNARISHRLPHVRFEVTHTTLFPTSYITAVRNDSLSRGLRVNAQQLDDFNATPHAQQLQKYARLAFRQLLASQSSLTATEIAQLFGLSEMALSRWIGAGLIRETNEGYLADTAELIEHCQWCETLPH